MKSALGLIWFAQFVVVFIVCAFAAPNFHKQRSWPPMKTVDIWGDGLENESPSTSTIFLQNENTFSSKSGNWSSLGSRGSRGFHLFPVPVDGECMSNDGRRTGQCFNAYECRLKGGVAQGDCALGFGVCCIFIATCDQVISNNITYLISPNFPSPMQKNLSACSVKVKMLSADISQLRIDFYHFSLGQPNRTNGVCDGDIFKMTGGPADDFLLCGLNSGQHAYYDVGGRDKMSKYVSREGVLNLTALETTPTPDESEEQFIDISLQFSKRFLPSRFWEIRIAQIPFSQRAPAGCLQYYTDVEGMIQTFNFADNGRHLANQNYKICFRQAMEMCSIAYEPCDSESFRIGMNVPRRSNNNNASSIMSMTTQTYSGVGTASATLMSTTSTTAAPPVTTVTAAPIAATTTASTAADDAVEGSGDDSDTDSVTVATSSEAPPVRGGLDIMSLFRTNIFDMRRRHERSMQESGRHFTSSCQDRITMPCIVEDFIAPNSGPLPGCEPVHCGNKFCFADINPCRIESTVTPFYLGVRFGDGKNKGSPEDNIGACIKYSQMQCM